MDISEKRREIDNQMAWLYAHRFNKDVSMNIFHMSQLAGLLLDILETLDKLDKTLQGLTPNGNTTT